MRIQKITITGADDSISPYELLPLSKAFPLVEWGILFSSNHSGANRFPSDKWFLEFLRMVELEGLNMENINFSTHLCGGYVRDIIFKNNFHFLDTFDKLGHLLRGQRVQLNFHAHNHNTDNDFSACLKKLPNTQFIFQFDDVNNKLIERCKHAGINVAALYDLSGGAGVLPDKWEPPIPGISCGYAGGLSPANITEQLQKIDAVVGDTPIWIDVETHVRSKDDAQFDLVKVYDFLHQVMRFINAQNHKTK